MPKQSAEITELKKWLNEQFSDIKRQNADVTARLADLSGKFEDFDGQLLEIQVKNDELSRENIQLKAQVKDLEENVTRIDAFTRRQNLLFYGLAESTNTAEATLKGFLEELAVDTDNIEFQAIHRIGRARSNTERDKRPHNNDDNNDAPRPIIARFARQEDVQRVKRAVYSRRKGAQPRVGVEEDLPPAWVKIRKQAYLTHVKPAKADGLKTRWAGPSLFINNKKADLSSSYEATKTQQTAAPQITQGPSTSGMAEAERDPLPQRTNLRSRSRACQLGTSNKNWLLKLTTRREEHK